jgi:dTDP-4-dehydrorhamnose reductase
LQWIDGVLSSGAGADFFEDEYRCPVFVKDVVQAIKLLMEKSFAGTSNPMHLLLNVGGPDRVSRAAMAETVADVRGYDKTLVRKISSQTAVSASIRET